MQNKNPGQPNQDIREKSKMQKMPWKKFQAHKKEVILNLN